MARIKRSCSDDKPLRGSFAFRAGRLHRRFAFGYDDLCPPTDPPPGLRPRDRVMHRCASCLALLLLTGPLYAESVSFRNDVMAVLSRAGCNSGACHGNQSGKGGLKLSLRGQDADADFATLTRDMHGRRLDPLRPDDSLILA